jgi:hypothetical protein
MNTNIITENTPISTIPANPVILKDGESYCVCNKTMTSIMFDQFSGVLANIPYVKIVVDRQQNNAIYFLNDHHYTLHAYFVVDHILKLPRAEFFKSIDEFNHQNYLSRDRRFYFATLGKIKKEKRYIYLLETQEIDLMEVDQIEDLFSIVKNHVDPSFELFFKPANHFQEKSTSELSIKTLPRILTSEIYATANFIALNPGEAVGRIRSFIDEDDYRKNHSSIEWYDIVVMKRVPDDVPRVAGIINADLTTPLSHTNILASGWKIPNCIQKDIFVEIEKRKLEHKWVKYCVNSKDSQALLEEIETPKVLHKPNWLMQKVSLEVPDIDDQSICSLSDLRMTDRYIYGTKAANLGEMFYLISEGSERLLGFYQIPRPPRENLLSHLANFFKNNELNSLNNLANNFIKEFIKVPRGIALPFSMQRKFLESNPQIQQAIGKLKMALELNALEIDSLCVSLQQLILKTRMPDYIKEQIDHMIMKKLAGVKKFVVRSSSNAEDLENFSAAGIYESSNHLTNAQQIFDAVKRSWASLVSSRSVRLRQQAGISLDDSYMGVIIQEEMETGMGGVMVTTNPMDNKDFRNVYINVSLKSVVNIVQGSEMPLQYLYNTVEGGGYTLSLGGAKEDISKSALETLQKMSFAGRLMQSHFAPDYTFSQPVDIEWLVNPQGVYFLQIRPYAK